MVCATPRARSLAWNPEFIGPAAITLAHRYNEDSRDHGKKERMAQLNSQNGVWSCTFVGYCSEVCPNTLIRLRPFSRAK
ncbi:hypothetical protein ACLK2I_22980 [Escherichia coli]